MSDRADVIAPWLSFVGIGEDGVDGLSAAARQQIGSATLVFGGSRHLSLAEALIRGEARPWPSPFDAAIPAILERRGQPTCVLATGDPFHFGIGATLSSHLDRDEFRSFPQPSAFSLAAGRLGWPLQDVACLSLHGRRLERIIPELQHGARILALSWDDTTPARLAALLVERGFGASLLHVCERLGGPHERVRSQMAQDFAMAEVADLNTIGLELAAEAGAAPRFYASGLPDAAFEHDGQITKSPIRAVTLSALAPYPGQLLWDIGAGSGSVSIEWLLAHPSTRAVAVERQPTRAARVRRNATHWGVAERLEILETEFGLEPLELPTPDAIFIGGGATGTGILDRCRIALPPGGRLVINSVTLETQALLGKAYAQHGGELLTLAVARAEPVGAFHGIRPAMPVTQWRWTKP